MSDHYIGWEALDAQLRWISDKATRVAIVSNFTRSMSYQNVIDRILIYHHESEAALFGDIFSDVTLGNADEYAPNRVLS